MAILKRGSFNSIQEMIDAREPVRDSYKCDVSDAVSIIKEAIENDEQITIIGDYDADGISATSILVMALREAGANPAYRLPLRFSEGYGMKPSMVEEIDSGLIITVDNGIASHSAIEAAKEKGLQVVVTDHHLPVSKSEIVMDGSTLKRKNYFDIPKADCVIDAHIQELQNDTEKFDFYDYCGAGIALKLAESLIGKNNPLMDKLYAFAAIATVADVVPLKGDNVNIFKRGIKAMAEGKITDGLYQLLVQNKIDVNSIPADCPPDVLLTGDVMGYTLGPCFNASSRLFDAGASEVVRCLLTDGNMFQATKRAQKLIEHNEERKQITDAEMAVVKKIMSDNHMENDCPIVLHIKDSKPGIIGLHAGRLCEEYQVPVIVLNGEKDCCKGSCRSPENAHMKHMLDAVSDILVAYGGHAGAAGLTICEDKIDEFRDRLKKYCVKNGIKSIKDTNTYYDISIDAKDVAAVLEKLYNELSPFGEGNPMPTFLVTDFHVTGAKVINGKTGTHLKLIGDEKASIINFHIDPEKIPDNIKEIIDNKSDSAYVDVICQLNYDLFGGVAKPSLAAEIYWDSAEREKFLDISDKSEMPEI